MARLDRKVAVITGAAQGMGAAHARRFIAEGAKVILTDVNEKGGAALAKELGPNAVFVSHDVTRPASWADVVRLGEAKFGTINVLVNNAGAAWGQPIAEYSEAGWDKVIDTNVKSVFFLTRELLPLLEKAASADDPARVINVGSIDGIKVPFLETYAYPASKAAVHHLTLDLAVKLAGKYITVNAIAPKAPSGAAHITMRTMPKTILPAASTTSVTGFARSPSQISAKPDSTEMNSTCRILPSAKAPTKVCGMMFIRNGTAPTSCVSLT